MSFLKSGLDALLGQVLLRLGLEDASQLSLEKVCRLERPDLLDLGRRIGLEIEADAEATETAERIWLALQAALVTDAPVDHPEPTDAATDDIPWGYGQDRVTAIPVDPNRLYVYWEVTDEAIAAARRGLGTGGDGAWLSLRIYDTSGRLFDGTNAHGYIDEKVGRDDRQWFVEIGKPGSEAFVEIGLKSVEGYFVKVSRSGRVEFPRWGTPTTGGPEWMTVREQPGGIDAAPGGHGAPAGHDASAGHGAPVGRGDPGAPAGSAPADPAAGGGGGHPGGDTPPAPAGGETPPAPVAQAADSFGAVATETREWVDRTERTHTTHAQAWERQLGSWSWESGPHRYSVSVPGMVTERFVGGRRVHRIGQRTHVVYGPWEVVIRGIDAHMEKSVLGRWETFRSWVTEEGRESTRVVEGRVVEGGVVEGEPGTAPGSSERLPAGASERHWGAGSEVRLGGASEAWRLGASERRLGGASEYAYLAASERMMRGASERLLRGASERMIQGASEQRFAGASEQQLFRGASEKLANREAVGGASERHFPPLPPEHDSEHEPETEEKS